MQKENTRKIAEGRTAEYAFSETVKAGIYDNLEIDFRSIDI